MELAELEKEFEGIRKEFDYAGRSFIKDQDRLKTAFSHIRDSLTLIESIVIKEEENER